jgi:N-acetylmuramic acid 6-phosphate etherase
MKQTKWEMIMKQFAFLLSCFSMAFASSQCVASPLLDLLTIEPSAESLDYVANKKQFQLHPLMTEQRHQKTWNLSQTIQKDTVEGIAALLSVDEDVSHKFLKMAENIDALERAAQAIEQAILTKKKIYIYGCGATGRLAKQMESSFWRPFWKKISLLPQWETIKKDFPDIENSLIGEMTGADRALISSLEGFEDLQLIGKLQLEDHHIQPGDLVFAITEGGETSSVIGTVLAALQQYAPTDPPQEHLYFIYNNPDELLLPLERSRSVIENDRITKICLFTGPQSITGSTRMQATTSETFVMGILLEHAIHQTLKSYFSEQELATLGFAPQTMKERLCSFLPIQKAVFDIKEKIALLTDFESNVYANKGFATYFAKDALITVFIDSTERAPTFRLFPLDPINELERRSWIQVWTPAQDVLSAWHSFLGRPFRGLNSQNYEASFSTKIDDPYLRQAALTSLKKAGNEQQLLYDFSFSSQNIEKRGPQKEDIGVLALLADEAEQPFFQSWMSLFASKKAKIAVISVGERVPSLPKDTLVIHLPIKSDTDPLKIRQHIGLKMLLNAHSTGVMTKLGRVVGNTMTNVNPGNLKLIGRATFLIWSHVNDHLSENAKISYSEANAVLFDAMAYAKKTQKVGQNSEVGLSIIRVLESVKEGRGVSWNRTEELLQKKGLEKYLSEY